jgi:RNA polymerase sigma-70 factor, ECF subfamily
LDLADVFRTHERDIYTYFLRLSGNRHEAEELAQETFVRACSAALRFRGASTVRTWLFGIAHRVWLERLRRPPTSEFGAATDERTEPGDQSDWMHLLDTLRSLEPDDRESIVLVDVLGFAPSQAASLIDVTPEALRVRLHRARARFRERHEL